MSRSATRLVGPELLRPLVHVEDDRGFFVETYRRTRYAEQGIPEEFVQCNHSRSDYAVVRGMHYQIGEGTSKLVRVARGEIFDVVVDIRTESPTFGCWEGFHLSDENLLAVYCPVGFAHGFCVLSAEADVLYQQSRYYSDENERGIAYDDPEVGIEWPLDKLFPSERDASAPCLGDVRRWSALLEAV